MSGPHPRSTRFGPTTRSADPWRSRIVGQAEVRPESLVAHPQNWRLHPERQRRALRATLGEVGWVNSIMVNRLTRRVVDGHARLEEALAHGEPSVPVSYVELTPDEELLVLATLDPIAGLADADGTKLAALIARISTRDEDLRAMLDGLAAAHSGRVLPVDPDDIPAPPTATDTYVRPNQLWRLGAHHLLCGDALDPAAMARLLGDERPRLLVTDPPYGVALDLASRHHLSADDGDDRRTRRGAGHRNSRLVGDDRADWSAAYALVPSLAVGYVWHPALTVAEVIAGLERIGFELVSEVIWVKSRWAVGRRWYHWQHEGCLVVHRRGARLPFLGGRDQGTVWEAPSPKVGGIGADPKVDHPAQKPVALFERPIRNHLQPGELVYDPFLGSGTTLIAAEMSHRRCLGLEIDPVYVQVAIERWQALTGERAELIDEGAS